MCKKNLEFSENWTKEWEATFKEWDVELKEGILARTGEIEPKKVRVTVCHKGDPLTLLLCKGKSEECILEMPLMQREEYTQVAFQVVIPERGDYCIRGPILYDKNVTYLDSLSLVMWP